MRLTRPAAAGRRGRACPWTRPVEEPHRNNKREWAGQYWHPVRALFSKKVQYLSKAGLSVDASATRRSRQDARAPDCAALMQRF